MLEKLIHLEVEEVAQGLKKGKVLLVDVREREEYEHEHIEGSFFEALSTFDPERIPDNPDKTVVFYCRSGKRSIDAAMHFLCKSSPPENVFHMKGGILAWKEQGYPIIHGVELIQEEEECS